jgi:hypothetical protein
MIFFSHTWSSGALLRAAMLISAVAVSSVLAGCGQQQLGFEQVASGSNGPRNPQASYFQSAGEADKSWLPSALGSSEYKAVLARVDFSRQILVGVAAGERENASGAARIVEIYQYTGTAHEPINVLAKFGVLPSSCSSGATSRPFAVAVARKPAPLSGDLGYDFGNYPDSCGARR